MSSVGLVGPHHAGATLKTMLRLALGFTTITFFASVAALVAGVGKPLDRPLRFDPDPFVIPAEASSIGEWDLTVTVVNDSDQPARIVGVEEFCSSACFYGRGLPLTIPTRGRAPLTFHMNATKARSISEKVNFWTSEPSQPILTLRVEGNIREAVLPDASVETSHE